MPHATVIPELAYPDVLVAVDWLCAAFGFTVRLRIANHRAQLNVGDGAVVVTDSGSGTRSRVMVRVEDADAHYQRALQQGAHIVAAPATQPYGERQYVVEDLAGHLWTFSESVSDVDPRDWAGEV